MNTEFTVDYFIKKFEAIPEELFLEYSQGLGEYAHCAIGHCINNSGEYGRAHAKNSQEAFHLYSLFAGNGILSITHANDSLGWNIADVNNGDHPKYQQPTPKQRILAALYDIKKMQEAKPQVKEIIREKTVYVTVPESVKEQAKELLMS